MNKKVLGLSLVFALLLSQNAVAAYDNAVESGAVDIKEPLEVVSGEVPELLPEFQIASDKPGYYSYGSDYGRTYLAENGKEVLLDCYDDLLEQCRAFSGVYSDITARTVNYADGAETVYYLPQITGTSYSYSLSIEQIQEVISTLEADHPEFFWLDTFDYSYTSNRDFYTVRLKIPAEYASGQVRYELDEAIERNFNNYVAAAQNFSKYGKYMTAKKLHDDILNDVDYGINNEGEASEDLAAHSILAVLDDDNDTMPVCEGYSKAYSLMLNALGIDNIYVTGWGYSQTGGERHAWNLLKLDDEKYYWADTTWDDQSYGIIHYYFARGNDHFTDHEPNLPDGTGYEYQYGLPEVSDTDYEFMPFVDSSLTYGAGVVDSGKWGTKITWTVYDNGVLYINGSGALSSFSYDTQTNDFNAPWYKYSDQVNFLVIGKGITSIPDGAFWKMTYLLYAYVPDSVTDLAQYAFGNCVRLKAVRFPAAIKNISNKFTFLDFFTDIYYGGTEQQWLNAAGNRSDFPDDMAVHYDYRNGCRITSAEKNGAVVNVRLDMNDGDDGEVLIAAYDNNGTLGFVVNDRAEDGVMTFTDNRFKETARYKVYVWDGVNTLRPLAMPLER